MAFEHHPKHVRKTAALAITAVIGLILIGLLVYVYISRSGAPKETGSGSKLKDFYNTILHSGQSDKTTK